MFRFGALWMAVLLAMACASRPAEYAAGSYLPPASTDNLIPRPLQLQPAEGVFVLDAGTRITWQRGNREAERAADLLASYIDRATTQTLVAAKAPMLGPPQGAIHLTFAGADKTLGAEGYQLDIAPGRIVLRASERRGLLMGVQTIRQLLPPPGTAPADMPIALPALSIRDTPRFAWRGMHLDVCRHFMPLEFVKQYIDLLALYKFNTFHWHLTEDQGWRLHVPAYPRLTEVGAWRYGAGGRHGGYYTEAEAREVVAYAHARGIVVVPEIEMPGHSLAALAAYPQYSCTGGPFEVATTWGVFDDVYCAGKDETFEFLQGVLDHVLAVFPSEYIHIGGDECPKTRWKECADCQARIAAEGLADEHELQSYFIRRIETYLNARGRRLIGWDEILEGGLAPNATVMSWRSNKGGIEAARHGHDAVMTPLTHLYFDYRQSTEPGELGATYTRRTIDLERVYSFEPIPEELTPAEARHILGAQANVWTEQLKTPADVEYMVLPRMLALAEVVWSPADTRDWTAFRRRVRAHYPLFDALGHNYRRYD
jgi:hexosaminidase